MPTYKVRGPDGSEYGPVSAEGLRQWIAQKRANGATSVQSEGTSDWKPLSTVPEFADALATAPPVSQPLPPSGPVRTSRLAIASLICGILGFLCLPALASMVLGIMALVRINKSRGQLRGQGFAIAGLCLSATMMFIAVPAGMLLPALAKAKSKAQRIQCVSHLKQIALGARIFSGDNKGIFPPDFLSMSNELASPKILVCPGDDKHTPATAWADFDPRRNLTYEYLKPGIAESNAAINDVIFRCPIHNNLALGDGSAQQGPMNFRGGRPAAPR